MLTCNIAVSFYIYLEQINDDDDVYIGLGLYAPFDKSHTSSYWRSIVTMALSRINTEIKQDIGRKSRFLYPLRSTPPLNGSRRNIAITFGMEKRSVLPDGEMFDDTYSRIDAIGLPACDRQTDGRTAPLWPNLIAERLLYVGSLKPRVINWSDASLIDSQISLPVDQGRDLSRPPRGGYSPLVFMQHPLTCIQQRGVTRGNTKHRKGPQRTAKELRNTAKDRKGPQKHRKRTAKDHEGPQRSSETPQDTGDSVNTDNVRLVALTHRLIL